MEIRFDMIMGTACNSKCKYCYRQKDRYKACIMTDDVMNKAIEYIQYTAERLKTSGDSMRVVFIGGEPLLYIDRTIKVIEQIYEYDNVRVNIVTNGYLLYRNIEKLKYINSLLPRRLQVVVSYDYYVHDVNRYNKEDVYNAILLLHKVDIPFHVITVLTRDTLQYVDKCFEEFIETHKIVPSLYFMFNVDRLNISNTEFDYDLCKAALLRAKKMADDKGLRLFYNGPSGFALREYDNINGNREPREGNCIYSNIYAGIAPDGNVYQSGSIMYNPENIRKMFYFGNVLTETPEELDKNENAIVEKIKDIKAPDKCFDCTTRICRYLPWRSIKTDISEFNGEAPEINCTIQKLISSCVYGE